MRTHIGSLTALAAVASIPLVPLSAQTVAPAGGNVQTVTFNSSLLGTDNYDLSENSPGNAVLWTNSLDVQQDLRTPIDRFSANIGGDLRVADLPEIGQDTALDNGRIDINYEREIDDNALRFAVDYNDVDIEFFDPLRAIDEDGTFDDTTGGGRRRQAAASATIELEGDGPIQLDATARLRSLDYYDDVTDPDLVDSMFYSGSAQLGFSLSDTSTAFIRGSAQHYEEEEDITVRDSHDVRGGLSMSITPITRLTFDLGYSRVKADRSNGDDSDETSTVGSVNLDIARPNGALSFGAQSRLTENGTRNELFVQRSLDLPAGGLDLTLGTSNSGDTDLQPLASLSYRIDRPTSQMTIGLDQSVDPDDDGDDRFNSSASLSYNHQINNLSSFGLTATAGRQVYLQDDASSPDVTRYTLEARYAHTLTRDWAVSGGLRHRARLENGGDSARENAVFIDLTRKVSFRN